MAAAMAARTTATTVAAMVAAAMATTAVATDTTVMATTAELRQQWLNNGGRGCNMVETTSGYGCGTTAVIAGRNWHDSGWRCSWNHGWNGSRYHSPSRYYYPRGYWAAIEHRPASAERLLRPKYLNYNSYGLAAPYGCYWVRIETTCC
jgi:hypothetical protein